jgi:predicted outer membrane lipoprotein
MINAYRRPDSETLLTWEAFVAAGLLDLPALGQHAPPLLYAYPAFFVVMGAGVLLAAAFGAVHAARMRAVRMSEQRQRRYPRYRHRSLLAAQAAVHQPGGREHPEESRERAR